MSSVEPVGFEDEASVVEAYVCLISGFAISVGVLLDIVFNFLEPNSPTVPGLAVSKTSASTLVVIGFLKCDSPSPGFTFIGA